MATNLTPIACTLSGGDYRVRLAEIADLNRRHLRSSSLQGRSLKLHYAEGALAAVRDLVDKESRCCAFLAFDLQETAEGITLRIDVPERAAEHAEALLSPFRPA